jgi:hypothetical protein
MSPLALVTRPEGDMSNPENARLLAEEAALSEAESAIAQAELDLWAKLEALEGDDLAAKAQAALDRVSALETAGVAAPEFPKVRAALQSMVSPPVLAPQARAAAVAARQAASQARSAAATALGAALTPVETTKAARKRDVDAIDNFIGKMEAAVRARQAGGTQSAVQPVPPKGRA